jgi:hypothetical protein
VTEGNKNRKKKKTTRAVIEKMNRLKKTVPLGLYCIRFLSRSSRCLCSAIAFSPTCHFLRDLPDFEGEEDDEGEDEEEADEEETRDEEATPSLGERGERGEWDERGECGEGCEGRVRERGDWKGGSRDSGACPCDDGGRWRRDIDEDAIEGEEEGMEDDEGGESCKRGAARARGEGHGWFETTETLEASTLPLLGAAALVLSVALVADTLEESTDFFRRSRFI